MMTTNKKLVTRNNNVDLPQKHVQVTKPGPFSRTKWALMRGVLSTIGRTSKGIQIGYRYGFDSGIMLDYVYVNEAHGLAGALFVRGVHCLNSYCVMRLNAIVQHQHKRVCWT